MKRVSKVKLLMIVPLVLIILYSLTYVPHKIVTIDPSKVSKIEVMDGNSGKQTTIEAREEVEYIIANLNAVTFQKGKPSFMYMGYSFRFKIFNYKGKVVEDVTINSNTVIRYKGFFYTASNNEIDYEYLKMLLR